MKSLSFVMKMRNSVFLIIIILCLLTNLFSQVDSTKFIKNPDKYLAEQIFNKRIIMLADFHRHHSSNSNHTCLSVLNNWLEAAEIKQTKCNLTLILEDSPEDAALIADYIKTGNIDTLIYMMANSGYLEDLEFYSDLKDFSERVSNSEAFKRNLIRFSVKGFEEIGSRPPLSFGYKTNSERDWWFVTRRDSMVSKGIIDYLNSNPNEKALVFYGSAHLNKKLSKKMNGTYELKGDSLYGYYIAYYLKNSFGDKVHIVSQDSNPAEYLNDGLNMETMQYEFYAKSEDIPWNIVNSENYDAIIFRKRNMLFIPHPLNYLLCRKLTESTISYMKEIENIDRLKKTVPTAQFFTWLYFGVIFEDAYEFEKWYYINKERIDFKTIDSIKTKNRLFAYSFRDTSNISNTFLLGSLGFILTNLFPFPDSVKWQKDTWPEMKEHVKFINAVGIYWIGFEDEKVNAKEFLRKFSGEDFESAKEYFRWYRMKYYEYDF